MNIFWYIIGLLKGASRVILEGSDYTFTDPDADGNIVIEEAE